MKRTFRLVPESWKTMVVIRSASVPTVCVTYTCVMAYFGILKTYAPGKLTSFLRGFSNTHIAHALTMTTTAKSAWLSGLQLRSNYVFKMYNLSWSLLKNQTVFTELNRPLNFWDLEQKNIGKNSKKSVNAFSSH